jgi:hypothetical protein
MRHQRTFDVSNHLFGREFSRGQNMDLFDRATLTLYDFCGHHSRKRQDQLFSTLDREYAASDVVQIQFVRRILEGAKQGTNIAGHWGLIKQ